jgi:hypothetical protein
MTASQWIWSVHSVYIDALQGNTASLHLPRGTVADAKHGWSNSKRQHTICKSTCSLGWQVKGEVGIVSPMEGVVVVRHTISCCVIVDFVGA